MNSILMESNSPTQQRTQKDNVKVNGRIKHGMYGTPEYRSYSGMITRCTNKNSSAYANYGGRGIKVCDKWRNSFLDFFLDMGPKPTPNHSIDRINNDGDYEPGNCRWATQSEQGNNTRQNRLLTYDGLTLTVTQWAERLNIKVSRIRYRIRHKYTADKILYIGKHTRHSINKN